MLGTDLTYCLSGFELGIVTSAIGVSAIVVLAILETFLRKSPEIRYQLEDNALTNIRNGGLETLFENPPSAFFLTRCLN